MLDTKFWQKYFLQYDALNNLIPYQELLAGIRDALGDDARGNLLDLGSGTGNVCMFLGDSFDEKHGIDSSQVGIDIHNTKEQGVMLCHADITEPLPYEDEYFNVVVSNNVLYTIDPAKRDQLLKQVYRILKPGGKFVVSNLTIGFKPGKIYLDHIKKSLKRKGLFRTVHELLVLLKPTVLILYYNDLIRKEDKSGQYGFFTPGEQEALLRDAGFTIVHPEQDHYYAKGAALITGLK